MKTMEDLTAAFIAESPDEAIEQARAWLDAEPLVVAYELGEPWQAPEAPAAWWSVRASVEFAR